MNIIAKDLLNDDLKKDSFLIFLFMEAGQEENKFKEEIDYYQSLKSKNCPCKKNQECPIVLCYLQEVSFYLLIIFIYLIYLLF